MGAETKTHFAVDKSKCTKCGKRINTCSGMVIESGDHIFQRRAKGSLCKDASVE